MIISFMPDLIMRSKLDVASRHYSVPVTFVTDIESFREVAGPSVHSILIDIDANPDLGFEMIRLAKKYDIRTIAFCSHVLTDLIKKTRESGATMVYSNSNMTASLPGLVSEIAFVRDHHQNTTQEI